MVTETINERVLMDEKTLKRIAQLESDVEQLSDQIHSAAEAEKVVSAARAYQSNRIGAMEWEKWFIQKNIWRLKNGLTEMPWPDSSDWSYRDDDEYQADEVSTH